MHGVDDEEETGMQAQIHIRNHIDGQLKEFHGCFSNQPFRPTLLEALVKRFGSLEMTLYRIGAKHDVSFLGNPSCGLVKTLEELSNDFKIDIAHAMTLRMKSCYMGVDKLEHSKKHLFAFSNQDQVNNLKFTELEVCLNFVITFLKNYIRHICDNARSSHPLGTYWASFLRTYQKHCGHSLSPWRK